MIVQTPDLISVITPCYNASAYLPRLLDSVLKQDYPRVEMICVDDGSTDQTYETVMSYQDRFLDRGYTLRYVSQEHSGQARALSTGLSLINGEFLIWPDSDDFFWSKAMLSMMREAILKADARHQISRCRSRYLRESDMGLIRETILDRYFMQEDLFEDCLLSRNHFLWGAGNYMVRVSALRKVLPKEGIYCNPYAGQNAQILLPMLWSYKCVPVPEVLHCIVKRAHSHGASFQKSCEDELFRADIHEEVFLRTIQNIPSMSKEQLTRYEQELRNDTLVQKARSIFLHGHYKEYFRYMRAMRFPMVRKVRLFLGHVKSAIIHNT